MTELIVMAETLANLSVRVSAALLRKLNVYARLNDKTLQDVVTENMTTWVKQQEAIHGLLSTTEDRRTKRRKSAAS